MKQLITILTIVFSAIFITPAATQAQNIQQIEIVNAPNNLSKAQFGKSLFSLLGTTYFNTNNFHAAVKSLRKKNGKWYFSASKAQLQILKQKAKIIIRLDKIDWIDIAVGGTNV
jgi:hypothetical protein